MTAIIVGNVSNMRFGKALNTCSITDIQSTTFRS